MKEEDIEATNWENMAEILTQRAGKSVGEVKFGFAEADVILMREICTFSGLDKKVSVRKEECSGITECSWCDELFLTQRNINRHILLTHIQWDTKCSHCQKAMVNSIVRHECQDMKCPSCEKKFNTKAKLSKHLFQSHGTFFCQLCEMRFDSLGDIKNHIEQENEFIENSCLLCKRVSKTEDKASDLKQHLIKFHFGPQLFKNPDVFDDKNADKKNEIAPFPSTVVYKPNKTEKYQFDSYCCPHCERKFSAKSGLKIHVSVGHKGGKILFCPKCPAAFKTIEDCKVHFKQDHRGAKGKKKLLKSKHINSKPKSLVPTDEPVDILNIIKKDEPIEIESTPEKEEPISQDCHPIEIDCNKGVIELNTFEGEGFIERIGNIKSEQDVTTHCITENLPNYQQSPPKVNPVPPKPKPKRPLPGLVKIDDLLSASALLTNKQEESNKMTENTSYWEVYQPKGELTITKRPKLILPKPPTNRKEVSTTPPTSVITPFSTALTIQAKSKPKVPGTISTGAHRTIISTKPSKIQKSSPWIFTQNSQSIIQNTPIQPQLLQSPPKSMCNPPTLIRYGPVKDTVCSVSSNKQAPILLKTPQPPKIIKMKPVKPSQGGNLLGETTQNLNSGVQVMFSNQMAGPEPNQVYVPAQTSSGTTILLKIEEARQHLQNGKVTFLPHSGQAAITADVPSSMEPIIGNPRSIELLPDAIGKNRNAEVVTDTNGNKKKRELNADSIDNATGLKIISVEGSCPGTSQDAMDIIDIEDEVKDVPDDIMRDKVALNLPVVMTKRTNKKWSQDNPFFKIESKETGLYATCRLCNIPFMFPHTKEMETHFNMVHNKTMVIFSTPLQYEFNYQKAGSKARLKFFLCSFCGKEFTTKFNVRRHQMLYCPRKAEIDPKSLGLGKKLKEAGTDPIKQ